MRVVTTLVVCATLAACATTEEAKQAAVQPAVDTALARAIPAMNCREATATVLGRTSMRATGAGGFDRQQYTIGVAGCGKQMNVVVVCSEGSNCFVAGTDR